jgi:hypothetical protein
MDVTRYAREQWTAGIRDESEAAGAYLTEALASDDPTSALFPSVRAMIGEVFRQERNRVEDRAFPLEDSVSPNVHAKTSGDAATPGNGSPGRQATTYRPGPTRHEQMQLMLDTEVWVAGRGLIPWSKITIEDIDATIPVYRAQIHGVERRIAKLESARKLILEHGADCLGDVPWEEAAEVIEEIEEE